ncbi:two-component response regulator YxdK [Bacillus subtilis]|uniref:Two-component response regulator YxdK n=1 Tax=Bacillus subtilis TaxID=1423 RepID=A0A0D1KUP2_BACIU|nr:two-component response regulator YxdK [Bacillus subtilis]
MNKIMIVEDSEDIRGLLQNYLEKYGYQTVVAADFTAVLDVFLREKPDVVLLDINLPAYDGYYWCRQIRQHSTSPIIFFSARSGEMDQVMAIENGGTIISKNRFLMILCWRKSKARSGGRTGSTPQSRERKWLNMLAFSSLWNGLNCVFRMKKASFLKKKASFWKCCLSGEKR